MHLALPSFFPFAAAGSCDPRIAPAPQPLQQLQSGALLVLPHPVGARLHCVSGCLWITQDGDSEDIVLYPGDSHASRGAARVIVQALEASALLVHTGRPR